MGEVDNVRVLGAFSAIFLLKWCFVEPATNAIIRLQDKGQGEGDATE